MHDLPRETTVSDKSSSFKLSSRARLRSDSGDSGDSGYSRDNEIAGVTRRLAMEQRDGTRTIGR